MSTSEQSCDRQERDLLEFAASAGYEVVTIFRETASGAKDNRPERKQVLALAQKRKIDLVLVTELSRWGRSTVDLLTTLRDLESWGVSLIAQTGLTFDLSTPQGKLLASIFAALSEFERDLLRERVRSGMVTARAKGKQIGRKPLSPEQTSEVYRLRAEGKSYSQIAKQSGVSRTKVFELCRELNTVT